MSRTAVSIPWPSCSTGSIQVRAEIGNAGEHLRPVGADLIAAAKRSIRMGRLAAVVVVGEERHERVDVVRVGRLGERGDDRGW
jgi:predicted methyltransferase MtxX (methanogen marker protein 4)